MYARSHLDGLTLRQARRALHTARHWWQEASAPISCYRPANATNGPAKP